MQLAELLESFLIQVIFLKSLISIKSKSLSYLGDGVTHAVPIYEGKIFLLMKKFRNN